MNGRIPQQASLKERKGSPGRENSKCKGPKTKCFGRDVIILHIHFLELSYNPRLTPEMLLAPIQMRKLCIHEAVPSPH